MPRGDRLNHQTFARLVSLFALLYLAIRLPAFARLVDLPAASFEPVGILSFLGSPVPDAVWYAVLGILFVSGALTLTGRAANLAMPLFSLCVLVATTYRSSWGQLLWFENLLVIHLMLLSVAAIVVPNDERRSSRWPMQWCAIATVVLYMLAGVAKLRYGGVGWMNGDVLANHIGYSSARLSVFGERPPLLASFAMSHRGLLAAASFTTVMLELAAPLALLRRPIAMAWSIATWAMHVGIALTMAVVFPYPIVGLAFVPVIAVARLRSPSHTSKVIP